jgi:hypothetical protein
MRRITWPDIFKTAAILGIAYETLLEEFDRPYLLALFGAMLGLGEFVQAAFAWRRNGNGNGNGSGNGYQGRGNGVDKKPET